jgi:hypothetical protein
LWPSPFSFPCYIPCLILNNCFPRMFHLIGRNSPSPRPRSRSPPYNRRDDRRHSPTRYPEYPSDPSRLPHYRGRVESPPLRLRGPDRLDRRDTPPDLPQRRPRGISDARDPDYAPKRRKMDDDDGNFPPVRRGTVGADTHIPLEPSPASASPRSTGPLDDLSRMSSLSHQPFIVTLVSSMCIRNFQDSAEENLCLHKAIVIKRHLISLLDHRFLAQIELSLNPKPGMSIS